MQTYFQNFSSQKLTLILLVILYLPLILWGGYFIDDVRRAFLGQYAWSTDYRPIIDFLYYLLGQGVDFLDLYPFNYLMQMGVLYLFIPFAAQRYLQKLELDQAQLNYLVLGWFFVFCNPFFLQNLYFRYDSLPMVLSIVWISLPFLIKTKKWWQDFALVLLVLLTYQPTVVGYVLLTCLELILLAKKNPHYKRILAFLSYKVISLIAAFVIFKGIATYLLEPNKYAEHHFEVLGLDQLDKLIENILFSTQNLVFSTSLTDQMLIALLIFLAIAYAAKVLIVDYRHKIGILLFVAFLAVIVISLLNPNIILYYPRLYPRVYVAVGFFTLLVVVLLMLSWLNENNQLYRRICQFLLFYLLLLNVNITYASFNAMKEMQQYEQMIMHKMLEDLSSLPEINGIEVFGTLETTENYEVLTKKYSIIAKTMETKINMNKHRYVYYVLANYGYSYSLPMYSTRNEMQERINTAMQHMPHLENRYYSLYYVDTKVIILLKQKGEIPQQLIARNRLG